MKHDELLKAWKQLAGQLPDPSEIVRGSLLDRKISHRRGCAKCRRGQGHRAWVLTVGYPGVLKSQEKDLPGLLNSYAFPRRLRKKLRTTNSIERCFVEVRRRTRPMVVFTNVQSVDRIIDAIFNRFNEDWRNHTLELFTQTS